MPNRPTHDELGDRTIDLLGLADVRRWCVVRTLHNQSVAEHAFAVMIIAADLYNRLQISFDLHAYGQLAWWAIIHDVPETLTGDIDGKFKRNHPQLRAAICEAENEEFPWYAAYAKIVDPKVKAVVKLADKIEAIRFIQDWGHGARANDVYHELNKILFDETVPWAAGVLGLTADEVWAAVRFTLHNSTSESNSIQMRRHRERTAVDEVTNG